MQDERRPFGQIPPFQIGATLLVGAVVFALVRLAERVPPLPEWSIAADMADLKGADANAAARTLNALQESSFDGNREFCGYLYRSGEQLEATPPSTGDTASCAPDFPLSKLGSIDATYHTHGGADPAYDNETPSVRDMRFTLDTDTDDYVATPGGRLWHISAEHEAAMLICGPGCLKVDPKYQPCPSMETATSFRLEELRERATESFTDC